MLQNSADKADKSHIFKLKNSKLAMTVDMAHIPCGLNGAVCSAAIDAKVQSLSKPKIVQVQQLQALLQHSSRRSRLA